MILPLHILFFFFNDTATTEIYTLSLHDALPIFISRGVTHTGQPGPWTSSMSGGSTRSTPYLTMLRSEEHTSELQSHLNIVCRLLLEKKKKHSSSPSARAAKDPLCTCRV